MGKTFHSHYEWIEKPPEHAAVAFTLDPIWKKLLELIASIDLGHACAAAMRVFTNRPALWRTPMRP